MKRMSMYPRGLDTLQKISVSLMASMVVLTFVGANLHALLWQQSAWLVSTVLPAVVVDLTNEERAELNAPQLQRNNTLDEAATLKAQHMAQNEYFSHFSPTGVSPWHWFQEAGYMYAHAGENLAIHFTDSSEVVEAWMDSPTHRANIINQNYSEIGVGTAKGTFDGYDTVYVVQLFGAPAFVPESTEVPVIEEPAVAVTDTELELAEISAALEELSEVVEQLNEAQDTVAVVTSETPEVLSESTVTDDPSQIVDVFEDEKVMVVEDPLLDDSHSVPDVPEVIETEVVSNEEVYVEPIPEDVLVIESTIATSSGLAVASIATSPSNKAGTTLTSIATQPNQLLQLAYLLLGMLVMALLLSSAVFEARQLHFVQVSYSIGLMVGMGALWYVHDLLTSGAVIA